MPWTFLDYVDASGSNQIEAWLTGLPANTRTRVRSKLLRALILADALGSPLRSPHFNLLHGRYSDLMAIHFEVLGVAYRPLCCYAPQRGVVVLLAGATEHNNHYRPSGILDTALGRRTDFLRDQTRGVRTCLFEGIN
jgi:hypothetical protein